MEGVRATRCPLDESHVVAASRSTSAPVSRPAAASGRGARRSPGNWMTLRGGYAGAAHPPDVRATLAAVGSQLRTRGWPVPKRSGNFLSTRAARLESRPCGAGQRLWMRVGPSLLPTSVRGAQKELNYEQRQVAAAPRKATTTSWASTTVDSSCTAPTASGQSTLPAWRSSSSATTRTAKGRETAEVHPARAHHLDCNWLR